ncbi:uncharacterized protein LOC126572311 [Anopheles aquasalis]|uniref:uncharacterized protein LOC126572311 n=1 Tax=Anopheles aquasalis TaxID=42839 RepID=UPI00215A6DD7|nr:uncharacterized protein LOC126572311 [Anopheles aquasalis]XP_050087487.1 uncharacterized protein LOC126572311 [Anopheles aquasalis]
MHQLSTICVTLVIVSVLVQSANAKRGCAAFGHACYGGHGKRSSASAPEALDQGSVTLDDLPIPYAKLILDKQRSLIPSPEEIRANDPSYTMETPFSIRRPDPRREEFKYAIYAMLRQLMDDSATNHQDVLHQQQPSHQASFQRELSGMHEVERK